MKMFESCAPDTTGMNWLRGRLDNAFGIVVKHVSPRSFMAGQAPTIVDVLICG
jgi:glutathione S-transferase